MMRISIRKAFGSLFLLISISVFGQLREEGVPWSFGAEGLSGPFQHISLAPPDAEVLVDEDIQRSSMLRSDRFAVLVPVGIDPMTGGTWEQHALGLVWRVKLSLEGSLASSLYFEGFSLPEGVRLYLYDEDGLQLKGAFSHANNRPEGYFATELIQGGTVILELNVPPGIPKGEWFSVAEMTFGYAHLDGVLQTSGFGDSQFCEVNVNCSPEGDDWKDEKDGVVRIQVKANGSAYWCTGSMINNTSQDKTPYLLTADHCAYKFGQYATAAELAAWIFYFDYESAGCANPQLEPQLKSLTGCTKVAHDGTHGLDGSDFYLVKLMDNIPASYNVFFNGWSRVDVPSSNGVTIHHPNGDIKKISTYTETPESSSWQGNGLSSHWKVVWAETVNNFGVTEGGSSGAPLFDNIGRIVGTLTGGLASCSNPQYPDYYGKFHYHWESNGDDDTTQLKPWLDPGNTGVLSLTGITLDMDEFVAGGMSELRVYPNPVESALFVEINEPGVREIRLELLDLMGRTLESRMVPSARGIQEIRMDQYQSGIYFIRKSSDGKSVVGKIMKK